MKEEELDVFTVVKKSLVAKSPMGKSSKSRYDAAEVFRSALAPLAEWRRHGRALQILRIVLESSVSGDLHFRIRRRMFSGSLVCTSLQESETQLLRTFLHELMTSQRTRPDRGLAITHGAIDRLFTQPVLCHTAIIKLQNLCAYI